MQVFVVAAPKEFAMHLLPTEEQEATHRVDYSAYVSPCPDTPSLGVVAARTVFEIGEAMYHRAMRKEVRALTWQSMCVLRRTEHRALQ